MLFNRKKNRIVGRRQPAAAPRSRPAVSSLPPRFTRLLHESWLLLIPGFALVLLASASLEALRLYRLPALLPNAPGGALGDVIGQGLSRALGFNGATLLLIALFGIGWSLLTGMSWLRLMERVGG